MVGHETTAWLLTLFGGACASLACPGITALALPPVAANPNFQRNAALRTVAWGADEVTPVAVNFTEQPLTSALLHVSYDGRQFYGWSSGNDPKDRESNAARPRYSTRSRRRRRNRGNYDGTVRSVQGEIQYCLSKVYGNIDPQRVVVEGCSRTDKGVHARGMMAQIYCLHETTSPNDDPVVDWSIPGKRQPHPRNATDTSYFTQLPMNLTKLAFTLNRMLPHDISIMGIAPTPHPHVTGCNPAISALPFHPTLSCRHKTYRYVVSVGTRADPTKRLYVWHLDRAISTFSLDQAEQACQILKGSHNFAAFQGAPRGSDNKIKFTMRNTTCQLISIRIQHQSTWLDTETYVVSVTGDRFLYKMIRFLVGTVVGVGTGKLTLDNVAAMLLTQSRNNLQVECAPPHALVLEHVEYDAAIDWQPVRS